MFPSNKTAKQINIFNKRAPYLHRLLGETWHSLNCSEEDTRGAVSPFLCWGGYSWATVGSSGQGQESSPGRWRPESAPDHRYLLGDLAGAPSCRSTQKMAPVESLWQKYQHPPTATSVPAYAKHLLISAHDLLEYKQIWLYGCVISCSDAFSSLYLTLLGRNTGKFPLRAGQTILCPYRFKFSLHLYPQNPTDHQESWVGRNGSRIWV